MPLMLANKLTNKEKKTAEMAVKQRETGPHDNNQVDLKRLLEYIEVFHQQGYLPSLPEMSKCCTGLVKRLARAQVPRESDRLAIFLDQLRIAEGFLQTLVDNVTSDVRKQITYVVIKCLYAVISDPHRAPCPAASIVLVVIQGSEDVKSCIEWLIEEAERVGATKTVERSRKLLSTFYYWMTVWQCTPFLSSFVLAFVKALEEKGRFALLLDVSIENLDRLLEALLSPTAVIRKAVAPVVVHLLASLREIEQVLEKVASRLPLVLETLASDSDQASRQVLQQLVDIATHMVRKADLRSKHALRRKLQRLESYNDFRECLDSHINGNSSVDNLTTPPWPMGDASDPRSSPVTTPMHKVGLANVGNTCYRNSVFQALLFTKHFSKAVMTQMHRIPCYDRLCMLFGMMTFSSKRSLDPTQFLNINTEQFTRLQQHDSSEFLGYLLELLHTEEARFRAEPKDSKGGESPSNSSARSRSPSQHGSLSNCTNNEDNVNGTAERSFGSNSANSNIFITEKDLSLTNFADSDDDRETDDKDLSLTNFADSDDDGETDDSPPPMKRSRLTVNSSPNSKSDWDNIPKGGVSHGVALINLARVLAYLQSTSGCHTVSKESLMSASANSGEYSDSSSTSSSTAMLRAHIQSLSGSLSKKSMKESSANNGEPSDCSPTSSAGTSPRKQGTASSNSSPASSTQSRQETLVQHLFGGSQLTQITCSGCNSVSTRRDAFRDIQLAIPEKEPESALTVQALVDFYCTPEQLSGENQYKCPTCDDLRDAERAVTVESSPRYLILVLKNFRYDPTMQVRTKLLHTVQQSKFVYLPSSNSRTVYEIYAFIVHDGLTLDSGHFYTYAKDNNHWFQLNDEYVSYVSALDIDSLGRSCTPYILFYKRKDVPEDNEPPSIEMLPRRVAEEVQSTNKELLQENSKDLLQANASA